MTEKHAGGGPIDERVEDDSMMGDGDRRGDLPQPPAGVEWNVERRFAIALPRRFHLLSNTGDPFAMSLRGVSAEENRRPNHGRPPWPEGFWDPEVLTETDDGAIRFTRFLEFDVKVRAQPLTATETDEVQVELRQSVPEYMAGGELPGYRLLDVYETRLGALDAFAVEYLTQGLLDWRDGGDHSLLLVALTPSILFHVYHHCPDCEWAARKPELNVILASFRAARAASCLARTRKRQGFLPRSSTPLQN